MPIRVYEYNARTPLEQKDRVFDQMFKAHRYHNKLVEIELRRRAKVKEVLEGHDNTVHYAERVKQLDEALLTTRNEINKLRKAKRSTAKTETADLRERAKQLRVELKEARGQLRDAKKALREDEWVQTSLKAANDYAAQEVRDARAASELYWGTYLIVEQAAESARKGPQDPRFKRWRGDGHLAVQLQKGLDTKLVFEDDPRCQIERPSSKSDKRTGRRRLQRTVMRLRVGSDGRAPIFAVIPIDMHRPLPEGRIKWVHYLRTKVANRYTWRVQFVVETETEAPSCGHGTVAIDVGWRMLDDGSMRVASYVDEFGGKGELRLPAKLISKDKHADSIRAIQDRVFDEVKLDVIEWLKGNPVEGLLPQHVQLWRNPAKLVRLYDEQRAAIPEALIERLEAWRRKDLHLWQWHSAESKKVLRQRREIYRLFAHQMSTTYGQVVLEKFDLRDVTVRGPAEEDTRDTRKNNYGRFFASVSQLRTTIKNACARRGAAYVLVPPEYTTQDCHACGYQNTWDQGAQLEYTCESCGVTWDQDENAARNLLALAPVSGEAPVSEEGEQMSARQKRFRKLPEDSAGALGGE